jgi:predicted nuclease of predicted toxin-antitoxin system
MPDRIRFHLDEHVDPAIAAGLQRYGIDVTTTVAAARRTKDDEVHLAFANAERRVIVTHDITITCASTRRACPILAWPTVPHRPAVLARS